jgi:nucleoid-associated protein YgaU
MATTYTVTRADVSLFHVAARVMGDALQWYRIAKLNNLDDPMIYGTMTIVVPDPDPTTTGGVPILGT